MEKVAIKIQYRDDIKTLKDPGTYSQLLKVVKSLFPGKLLEEFNLKYMDEEEEIWTIRSDDDYKDVLYTESVGNKTLKLKIQERSETAEKTGHALPKNINEEENSSLIKDEKQAIKLREDFKSALSNNEEGSLLEDIGVIETSPKKKEFNATEATHFKVVILNNKATEKMKPGSRMDIDPTEIEGLPVRQPQKEAKVVHSISTQFPEIPTSDDILNEMSIQVANSQVTRAVEIKDEIEGHLKQEAKLHEEIQDLKKQLDQKSATEDTIREEMKELKIQKEEEERNYTALSELYNQIELHYGEEQEQHSKVINDYHMVKRKLESSESKVIELTSEKEDLEMVKKTLKEQIDQIIVQGNHMLALQTKMLDQYAVLENDYEKVKEDSQYLSLDLQNSEEENKRKDKEIEELLRSVQELKGNGSNILPDSRSTKPAIIYQNGENGNQEVKQLDKTEELKWLIAKLSKDIAAHEEHEEQLNEIIEENKKQEDEKTEKIEELKKLLEEKSQFEDIIRKEMSELDSKRNETEIINQQLSEQIELLQVQFMDQQEDYEKIKEDHQTISEDLLASENEIIGRDEEIENLLGRIQELEGNERDIQTQDTSTNQDIDASFTQILNAKDIFVGALLKKSELHMKLMECVSMMNCTVPFEKIDDKGHYKFGTKKITAVLVNERLMIRVGGGYMTAEEFITTYTPQEIIKVNRDQAKKSSTAVLVSTAEKRKKYDKEEKTPNGKSPNSDRGARTPLSNKNIVKIPGGGTLQAKEFNINSVIISAAKESATNKEKSNKNELMKSPTSDQASPKISSPLAEQKAQDQTRRSTSRLKAPTPRAFSKDSPRLKFNNE